MEEDQKDLCIRTLHNKGLSYAHIQQILKVGQNRISNLLKGQHLLHSVGYRRQWIFSITIFIITQENCNEYTG